MVENFLSRDIINWINYQILPLSCAPCKRSANINSKPLWAINLCTIIVAASLSSLRYLLEENKKIRNFIVDRDIPSETITAWTSSAVSNLWRLTSHQRQAQKLNRENCDSIFQRIPTRLDFKKKTCFRLLLTKRMCTWDNMCAYLIQIW